MGDALAEGARLSRGGMPAGRVQGGSHRAGKCGISKKAGREDPGVRAAKNSEFRKREVMSTLNEPN